MVDLALAVLVVKVSARTRLGLVVLVAMQSKLPEHMT